MSKHSIPQELQIILGFVAVLWIVFFSDLFLPGQFVSWGLVPRTLGGLVGIVSMPFIHGSLGHLIGNTIPLLVLLSLMAGSRANSLATTIAIMMLNGVLLWLVGRPSIHVGASGLIYGLIAFLILAGYFEKRPISIVVAIIVFMMYGTTLLFGVLPTVGSHVSWDGHLTGAIAGAIVAFGESRLLRDEATEKQAKIGRT